MSEIKGVRTAKFSPLTLTSTTEDNKKRSLTWASRAGYPRIVVYTDDTIKKPDGSTDYDKMIIATFTPVVLETMIRKFKKLIEKGTNDFDEVDCLYVKYNNGSKTEEVELRAKARFGIDGNGMAYFYVKNKIGTECKFNIDYNDWHVIRLGKDDPKKLTKEEASREHALSYLTLLDKLFTMETYHSTTVVTEVAAPQQNKPRYNNNYNNNNNYNKNYNNNNNNNSNNINNDSNTNTTSSNSGFTGEDEFPY